MQKLRLLLAFCIAPVVPVIMLGLYSLLNEPAVHPPFELSRLFDPGTTRVAYLMTIGAGAPAFLLMRRTRNFWWQYASAGALIGCLPGLALAVLDSTFDGFIAIALAFGAVYGALAGFIFWAIAIPEYGAGSGIQRS
jgi:hypothetical protein